MLLLSSAWVTLPTAVQATEISWLLHLSLFNLMHHALGIDPTHPPNTAPRIPLGLCPWHWSLHMPISLSLSKATNP